MVEIDEKQVFSIIQKAKDSGSFKIGANEVTKAVERGVAVLVATANDVSPAEIVAHFPGLCKEMKIVCASIGTKAELGAVVGIKSTTAVAIIDVGNAKKELEALKKSLEADKKETETKTEAKVEAPAKEEKKAEVKEETKSEKVVEEVKKEPAKEEAKEE